MLGAFSLLAAAAFIRDCPADPAGHQHILGAITENARNYAASLPDFLATRVTKQFVDHSGTGHGWRQTDTIEQQLAYYQHKETYRATVVNGKPGEAPGGLTTSGEFGDVFESIFGEKTMADFKWKNCSAIGGVPVYVFEYRETKAPTLIAVQIPPPAHAGFAGAYRDVQANVPYHGLIYAGRHDQKVMRITFEAEIARDFPLREAKRQIDYGWTPVGGEQFLLPQSVDVRSKFRGMLLRNQINFLLYRKFEADSVLKFDKP